MKIQQPQAALAAALIGLFLINVHGLFGLLGYERIICSLVGGSIFAYAFWTLAVPQLEKESADTPLGWHNWKTATYVICGLSFLVFERFAHVGARTQSAATILGWFLLFGSLTLPRSKWQPTAFFAIYALFISQTSWKQFLDLRGMQIYMLIAALVLWIAISGAIYLYLIRGKPTPPQQV